MGQCNMCCCSAGRSFWGTLGARAAALQPEEGHLGWMWVLSAACANTTLTLTIRTRTYAHTHK